ncbi:hypothetical protein [Lactobacillus gallinarum]|uniref:hypothetical protein n=1 Tax=Lactobacillus gallinarum TaxID=52242 RepID=UPI0024B16DF5|nr:hypothetical protein [Lactobacillus gallinarum]
MTDVRIQDFSENLKPDTNNDFLMTFNDSSESKTRLRDAFYAMVPDGAPTHNNIYRGANLGALNATHIANIQNGTFRDMFIGDYFSINGSNYVIAGINYKRHHGDTIDLGNHLVLIPSDWSKTPTQTLNPDNKTTHYMQDTDTTAGGFAGTKLYKTYLPQIQTKLESDFGNHLITFRTVVSTHVDSSGAPDQSEWRDAKVAIPNEVMIYGSILNGNNKNGSRNNIGDEDCQLPLMRLNDSERCNNHVGAFWLRDIHSASVFAFANSYGDGAWDVASRPWIGVRAFFLIG